LYKCVDCGEEFDALNYKHELCPKCYKIELEKAVAEIKKDYLKEQL